MKAAAIANANTPLLRLPQGLKNLIWAYATPTEEYLEISLGKPHASNRVPVASHVCHEFREAIRERYFSHTNFLLSALTKRSITYAQAWIRANCGGDALRFVRQLTINMSGARPYDFDNRGFLVFESGEEAEEPFKIFFHYRRRPKGREQLRLWIGDVAENLIRGDSQGDGGRRLSEQRLVAGLEKIASSLGVCTEAEEHIC